MSELKSHTLTDDVKYTQVIVENRPVTDGAGNTMDGVHNTWIIMNNPKQLNSYTTQMVKEVIFAFREASMDRACVAVVFTAVGDRAFCTGGNTKEYAEYYAGNPQEYAQYMRLFNDMVTNIMLCDKPVICRVNGMRIAGGQEIGMACDFHIAADTARFAQAGPRHGSAPDGGSTDFLDLYVGINRSMESCTLCEHWSAHRALRWGLINRIVPVLKKADGSYIPNPFVDLRETDEFGVPVFGDFLSGEAKAAAKAKAAECTVDLSRLDKEVNTMAWSLAHTMPGCLTKTLQSVRKKKLEHWYRNSETNRSWLGLNMMTEGRAGFRAFNEGPRHQREIDFGELRRRLAAGKPWDDEMLDAILPKAEGK